MRKYKVESNFEIFNFIRYVKEIDFLVNFMKRQK